jgi:cytidine deaminase
MIDADLLQKLIDRSLAMRARAYAPYSNFFVGAALLCEDGTIVDGCNVENASYGLCICAERTAMARAVADGHRRFPAVAVATASSPPSPPCGMCRQFLAEFCNDGSMVIVLVNDRGERVDTTIGAIFPGSFDGALLRSGQRA